MEFLSTDFFLSEKYVSSAEQSVCYNSSLKGRRLRHFYYKKYIRPPHFFIGQLCYRHVNVLIDQCM